MDPLLVAIGAGIGAASRYALDRGVRSRFDTDLPWATFAVNVVGSLLLGLLLGADVNADLMLLLGIGFCGALTTWSTLGFETFDLARGGRRRAALLNVAATVAVGIGVAFLGYAAGAAL